MNTDINLITPKKQVRHAYGKIFLITAFIFGSIFTVAMGLTFHTLLLKTKAGRLSEEVASARARMETFKERKQKMLIISERIGFTRNIISGRNSLERRTSELLSAIPDVFNIEAIKAETNVITIKMSSQSLLAFDDLLDAKVPAFAKSKNLGIKKIESTSFTTERGAYTASIGFYF